jgi:hypothetical protein
MTKEELQESIRPFKKNTPVSVQIINPGPKAGVSVYPVQEIILKGGKIVLVAKQK